MDVMDTTRTPAPPDAATRIRAVRASLPGQQLRDRIDTAALLYGRLYTEAEIRQRVAQVLPMLFGSTRHAVLEPIESYSERIPDEALLKYDDARQSTLFSRFMVATPTYRREPQPDPWILGQVTGTQQWAVIAQWDVPQSG
jgi:hypothetical protein